MEGITVSEGPAVTLEAIKSYVRGRLKQARAVSELIWEAGAAMWIADQRGLWTEDLKRLQALPSHTGRQRRNLNKPSRELWASAVFELSVRQARKYFTVGERLTRDEVAGTGLCLDRMEQLALATPDLRPRIRELAINGASVDVLRKARGAAETQRAQITEDTHPAVRHELEKQARSLATYVGRLYALKGPGGANFALRELLNAQPGVPQWTALVRHALEVSATIKAKGTEEELEALEDLVRLIDQLKDRADDLVLETESLLDQAVDGDEDSDVEEEEEQRRAD